MKVLFFYENDDMYTKAYLRAMFKNFRLYASLVGALGIIFSIFSFLDGQLVLAGVLFSAGCISLLTAVLLVPLSFRELKKQDVALTGGEKKVMLRFLSDAVELHQGNAHLSIQYRHIERVFDAEGLYVFQLGKQSGFYLPKEAVEDPGDLAEILEGPLKDVPKAPRNFFGK